MKETFGTPIARPLITVLRVAVLAVGFAAAAVQAHAETTLLCPIAEDWESGSGECPCEWRWRPTDEQLNQILLHHQVGLDSTRWMEFSFPERAVLCRANLANADLSGTNLTRANLSDAILQGADLSGATLTQTDLSGADLSGADMSDAELWRTDLRDAVIRSADLSDAILWRADLRRADLTSADLSGTRLGRADLSRARLHRAKLIDADLRHADLSGAILTRADLSSATIVNTIVDQTRFDRTILTGSTYEAALAPSVGFLAEIDGLATVQFSENRESGLVLLRQALQDAGLRPLEREATYAIERGRTQYMTTDSGDLGQWLGGHLRRVLFDWTTGYGLHPERALLVLFAMAAVMTMVFAYVIWRLPESREKASVRAEDDAAPGLYRIWPAERIIRDTNGYQEAGASRIEQLTKAEPALFGHALHFSLLSAFHIGWRDLNVGSWLTRLQRREYALRARGWVRVVSGLQSLISVYLLAIWVLTYFGRPFQ